MKLLKELTNCLKDFNDRLECQNLAKELVEEIANRRSINMQVTLETIANYLVKDQLERTGILYRPNDKYIQTKTQQLFWEWKNEGIIDEFEDFNDTTKTWIYNNL